MMHFMSAMFILIIFYISYFIQFTFLFEAFLNNSVYVIDVDLSIYLFILFSLTSLSRLFQLI